MMARKMAVYSFSSFAFSTASVSTNSKFTRPSEQPVTTPSTFPRVDATRVARNRFCSGVKRGAAKPSRSAAFSMVLPNRTPEVSLAIWPIAAAARLLSPNVTPTDASIASPAWMSTVLSTNPNAANGAALKKKMVRRSRAEGRGTGGGARVAPPPAALANERGRADDRNARALMSASRLGPSAFPADPAMPPAARPGAAANDAAPDAAPVRKDVATAGWKAPDVEAAAEVAARPIRHAAARRMVMLGGPPYAPNSSVRPRGGRAASHWSAICGDARNVATRRTFSGTTPSATPKPH